MKIAEQIKTTKGCYSLTMQIAPKCECAIISISDPETETFMRLDRDDLKRILLLISDHMPIDNG